MVGLSPTVAQRRLARALRRLRANADLTIDQVAEKFDLSASTISRLETAQARARKGDVRELLDIYGVAGTQREELLQLAGQSRRPPWWGEYKDLTEAGVVDLEAEAEVIRHYAAQLVPGILQTQEYAREVLRFVLSDETPQSRERHLRLRMNRQALFAKRRSPRYEIVLDEAVPRRIVGGPHVMRTQVERLIEASKQRNISLQLLPFATGAHPAMDSQFTVFRYQNSDSVEAVYEDPDVVYLENLGGGAFIEDHAMTERYNRNFEQLRSMASDSAKSTQTLANIRDELRKLERR